MPYKSKRKRRKVDKDRYKKEGVTSWNTSKKSIYKVWTKKEIQLVIDLWDKYTIAEICEKLDRKKGQVSYIAGVIRKCGYPLPKKMARNILNGLVKEAIKDIKK